MPLAQFDQNPVGGGRVQKPDALAIGSFLGMIPDHLKSFLTKPPGLFSQVFYLECHMMHSRPALAEKARNRTLRMAGFQQFQFDGSQIEECRANPLQLRLFHLVAGTLQQFFKQRDGILQGMHGNTNVFKPHVRLGLEQECMPAGI